MAAASAKNGAGANKRKRSHKALQLGKSDRRQSPDPAVISPEKYNAFSSTKSVWDSMGVREKVVALSYRSEDPSRGLHVLEKIEGRTYMFREGDRVYGQWKGRNRCVSAAQEAKKTLSEAPVPLSNTPCPCPTSSHTSPLASVAPAWWFMSRIGALTQHAPNTQYVSRDHHRSTSE